MKIIDIIKDSARLLGLEKSVALLETATTENEGTMLADDDVRSLFSLLGYSLRELCTNYIPVESESEITTTDKKFALSGFSNLLKLLNFYSNGEQVDFKIVNRVAEFEQDGTYTAKYLTYLTFDSLNDDIDFLDTLSPDLLVYGLCSYFALSKGMFDEFEHFHEVYLEKAENLKELKIFNLPQRRWE